MAHPKPSTRKKGLDSELHGVRLVYNRIVQEDHGHKAAGAYHTLDGFTSEARADQTHFPFRTVQPPEISLYKAEHHPVKTFWEQRPSWLRPMFHDHDGKSGASKPGDRNLQERVINVLTSIPFVILGLQIPRKTFASTLYGGSLCGVGLASTLYHVSNGNARRIFRYGDYAMIAVSSLCLSGAIRRDNSTAMMIASAMTIPLSPFVVSIVHTSLMQATFAQRVKTEPSLKKPYDIHKLSSAVGGVLFIADDLFPNVPYVHAAWHLAAAVGVATSAALVL